MSVRRLYSRYFCPRSEGHRVFPYDTFEDLTEGPEMGKKGDPVLLRSLNSDRSDDKWAWCWACNKWVLAHRKTSHQIRAMYLHRRGVSVRARRRERAG